MIPQQQIQKRNPMKRVCRQPSRRLRAKKQMIAMMACEVERICRPICDLSRVKEVSCLQRVYLHTLNKCLQDIIQQRRISPCFDSTPISIRHPTNNSRLQPRHFRRNSAIIVAVGANDQNMVAWILNATYVVIGFKINDGVYYIIYRGLLFYCCSYLKLQFYYKKCLIFPAKKKDFA